MSMCMYLYMYMCMYMYVAYPVLGKLWKPGEGLPIDDLPDVLIFHRKLQQIRPATIIYRKQCC